jgi:hypothetical protein
MNKFEKLIEYIINDEDQKARELFHDIVVEKSRDIYESIMDEEQMGGVHGGQVEDMVDEITKDEAVGESDEEFGDEEEIGGDEGSEFGDEEGGEEFGGDTEGNPAEEEIEDRVMNIDAKLDELLAKFDEIMGDEGHSEEMPAEEPAMDMGHEEPETEEMGMMEDGNPFANSGKSGSAKSGMSGKSGSAKSGMSGKSGSAKSGKSGKPFEGKKSSSELMREYVDRIGDIYGGEGDATEGDAVGAAGKKTSVNTKPGSIGPGNNFGGTAVTSKGGNQDQDGTTPTKASNEYNKGQGEINSGNRNVPGGKADKLETTGKEYSKSSEADGKLAGNDGKVAQNQKSVQVQNTGKK